MHGWVSDWEDTTFFPRSVIGVLKMLSTLYNTWPQALMRYRSRHAFILDEEKNGYVARDQLLYVL